MNRLLLLILVFALLLGTASAQCSGSLVSNTIYIGTCSNLTELNNKIANPSVLQNLGSGEWFLNANLINNDTTNTFYINESDVTWLKINSTYWGFGYTYWYYLTQGKTEINNTKITSWDTSLNTVNTVSTDRSAVYASGASSKMNISNSNLSYLGYDAANMYGVTYDTSSGNQIINNSFLQNYRGIGLTSSSYNILINNTGTSNVDHGIYLSTSSDYNTLTNNTGTTTSTSSVDRGIYLFSSSYNTLTNNMGTGNSGIGIYLYSSSNNNNLTSNIGTSSSSAGIGLLFSSNNNLTSNTGTSTSNIGIYLYSSSNNNLTSNTGTSNTGQGIYFYDSSYNTLINNTVTSNSNVGLYLFSSSNNNFTSNTFNTNSTTATIEDILLITSSRTNKFINTDFTTKPRKIEFYTALVPEFNQSQDNGVSFVNTNVSIATTTNRSIVNWNQTNITFTETFTGANQGNYAVTGLLPNTDYQIWNGTSNDFNFTTDASGILPDFTINFTTTIKTVQILQTAAEEAITSFNQSVYNVGWQTIFINSTQSMTSIRSMMNSSNVLWIARWNATTQKWESYKAGWSYRATNNASAGEAIYLKVANNDTVTRNNGTGNYNWTTSSGWNLLGLDYNGTRTLSQVNASINSLGTCDVDEITYLNLETQLQYTYTCGLTNNESISVNQGEGFWLNATQSFDKVRSW